MRVGILSIGNEILKGYTLNSNLSFIGRELSSAGVPPQFELTCRDCAADIINGLSWLLTNCDTVISTGGLGPTSDDLSVAVVADFLKLPLHEDPDAAAAIKRFWEQRRPGQQVPPNVMRQAMIPKGAEAVPNLSGTAPGIIIEAAPRMASGQMLMMLPGPPTELQPMFLNRMLPAILARSRQKLCTETIYAGGIPESVAEERLGPIIAAIPDVEIAYCASLESLRIHLSSCNPTTAAHALTEVKKELGTHVLIDDAKSLAEDISIRLRSEGMKLALAESCTGGLIAAAITDLPGSSDILLGSAVSYSNEWKQSLLGIHPELIIEHGAVSEKCARAMVKGLCRRFNADAGIAVTGIAGPRGGSCEKPIGLVFIATQYGNICTVKEHRFPGDRDRIRRRTVQAAIYQLREMMLDQRQEPIAKL